MPQQRFSQYAQPTATRRHITFALYDLQRGYVPFRSNRDFSCSPAEVLCTARRPLHKIGRVLAPTRKDLTTSPMAW